MTTRVDVARASFKLVLTSQEAGALVGRDPKTVASLCELGVIRASRDKVGGPWRIPRSSLDAWVAAGQPMAVSS
ncbi:MULTISPECIES: helix-turn-helix domain-containing protein [unclassified Dietzia]|uniref:helix-turn-helix domain-containing protein n=1 Tax=unclassified Dietzia TaxID=2617939 RepID=UPI0015FA255A|nr:MULTISPECIES: helix-turn-helix domain-containing protein [unclassified Dietzia]MBB1023328.1 helix-turn-helix domain-containing protein [Dietzia sp. DQ12-76]MBB1026493.1 helix-turn-helix domain-containing protein [Dietzia sp. DQ11-38-2]